MDASREYDELSGGPPGFHVGVGQCDLVQPVGALDRHLGLTGRDCVQEILQHTPRQIAGIATVGLLPGLLLLDFGIGLVVMSVSMTAMNGTPAARRDSVRLPNDHEVGAVVHIHH